jgi:hypothetical protein
MLVITRLTLVLLTGFTLSAQPASLKPQEMDFFRYLFNSIGGVDTTPAMRLQIERNIAAQAGLTQAQAAVLHSVALDFNQNLSAIAASKTAALAANATLNNSVTADLVSQRERLIQTEVATLSRLLSADALARLRRPLDPRSALQAH